MSQSILVDLRKLHAAKKANNLRLQDVTMSCQTKSGAPGGCGDLSECIKVNSELDREIRRLHTLKQKYNMKDFLEPEDMYLLDPTKKDGKNSDMVKYHPNMFMLDVGVPKCNTVGCNTSDDALFRINPNMHDNFTPDEEQYMLHPRSNTIVSKWEMEQRQKFKIYPHMLMNQTDLIADQQRVQNSEGGFTRGGVDYPIPMRYQLRYLQQPGHKGMGHNVDYDIHVKTKDRNLPEWHDKITEKEYMLRRPDVQQHNKQRGIENRDMIDDRLEQMFNKMHSGEVKFRDELRNAKRSYGYYPETQASISDRNRQQLWRENKQTQDIMAQPMVWYKDKGTPRMGTTDDPIASRGNNTCCAADGSSKVQSHYGVGEGSIQRAKGPSAEAQGPSGFFKLGPPIPPPNPELLSSVPSDMLVNYTSLAKLKDNPSFDVPKPIDRDDYLLKTDIDITLNPLDISDEAITQIFNQTDGGVDTPTNRPGTESYNKAPTVTESSGQLSISGMEGFQGTIDIELPENIHGHGLKARFDQLPVKQRIPNYEVQNECLDEPKLENLLESWVAKEMALQRIYLQKSHLERLIPLLRKKQIQAKETSHIMNIHKTTHWLDRINRVMTQLKLMHTLLKEERERLWQDMKARGATDERIKELHEKIKNWLIQRSLGKTSGATIGGDHYFDKLARGVGLFYTQSQFQGEAVELGYGFFDYPNVGGVGNNKLQSFKIPKNTELHLYEHPERKGNHLFYQGPARVAIIPSRWNKRISGIELRAAPPPYSADLYDGPEFQGHHEALKPGFYDYPNVGGIGNRRMASFRLPNELMMTIYTRPNKQGQKMTYIGPIEMRHMGPGWLRNVSGVEIQLK